MRTYWGTQKKTEHILHEDAQVCIFFRNLQKCATCKNVKCAVYIPTILDEKNHIWKKWSSIAIGFIYPTQLIAAILGKQGAGEGVEMPTGMTTAHTFAGKEVEGGNERKNNLES